MKYGICKYYVQNHDEIIEVPVRVIGGQVSIFTNPVPSN